MSNSAGRFIAGERGAFDGQATAAEPALKPRTTSEPIWKCARIDGETFAVLAEICNCTPDEFNERYE